MKKLLFILAVLFSVSLTSCETHNISNTTKEQNLPIIVIKMAQVGNFDTLYQIRTEDCIYVFDKDKQYKETIHLTTKYTTNDIYTVLVTTMLTAIVVTFLFRQFLES